MLGLFANGNMTPRYAPLVASAPPGAGGPDARYTEADRGDQPSLEQMTRKAIELLDNPNGFFLQVESAMVDKQEHASDICGAIGDVGELDRATQAALDFQAENPDTLIIVTSDHAHSTQIVPGTGSGRQTATLKTADGDPMHVAYSTQESGSSHTGTVTVELRRGSKRLTRKTIKANGGTTKLKASTTPGTVRVVVTARGAGGQRTAARTVRVR